MKAPQLLPPAPKPSQIQQWAKDLEKRAEERKAGPMVKPKPGGSGTPPQPKPKPGSKVFLPAPKRSR